MTTSMPSLVTENSSHSRFFKEIAKELVVSNGLVSYEKDGNVLYNWIAVIDVMRSTRAYCKTHIPDESHYYQRKMPSSLPWKY